MRSGFLSQYFEAVAAKKLNAVEINPSKSNQHEFNGSRELKRVLGEQQPLQFSTKFLFMQDNREVLTEVGYVTWYDAREAHPTRSEYRLYFPSNAVISEAREGDTLFIAKRTDNSLLIAIAIAGSTFESQLYWLFGLSETNETNYQLSEIDSSHDHDLNLAVRYILGELGIELIETDSNRLDSLIERFEGQFPSTFEFSKFARSTIQTSYNTVDDPDNALVEFMKWEEQLFRRLERDIVSRRLNQGFGSGDEKDVDEFINFSLSVQNRRKSRAGYAFEDHLTTIFSENGLRFTRKAQTEHKSKPDFLFPGMEEYKNNRFPSENLTMLGVKTSCKDRWRQILSEAARISEKHLLTLEPGISENQTLEMQGNGVRLIIPEVLHQTFSKTQQKWLMNLKEFITIVKTRQYKYTTISSRP